MRILIINTTPVMKGGITNVIFNLLRKIDKTDTVFDMLVYKVKDESLSLIDEFRSYGGEVFFTSRTVKSTFKYINTVKKLIQKNGYDAVHIHGNSHTVVLELIGAKLAGCKVRIVHAHSTKCLDIKMHKLLTDLFNKLCTHRIACGLDAGKFMFGELPFEVINNGVDVVKFAYNESDRDEIRKKHNLIGKTVIGHVGMFNDIKNQDFLLDILADLSKTNENYSLLLVGDGKRRPIILDKAKKMGIDDKVVFAGLTDDIPAYLSAFDMFMLTSFFEGLPLVLVEAQASGLHCVVSDCVTVEADKTGNMTFLPIDKGAQIWVDEILKRTQERQNREEKSADSIKALEEKGYSASAEAKKLLGIYRDAILGNK